MKFEILGLLKTFNLETRTILLLGKMAYKIIGTNHPALSKNRHKDMNKAAYRGSERLVLVSGM